MHIIKLCVGVSTVDELLARRAMGRVRGFGRPDNNNVHRTRMMPKRADEIVGQGSLYWVMSGSVRCRQLIVGIDAATDSEGKSCCDIILDPNVIRTSPYPRRPFQGWRYLDPKDAPADLTVGSDNELPPEGMAEDLARLGLI